MPARPSGSRPTLAYGSPSAPRKRRTFSARVLLRDAVDDDALLLERRVGGERHQVRVLEPAGLAPRAEHVDHADVALAQVGVGEAGRAVESRQGQRRRAAGRSAPRAASTDRPRRAGRTAAPRARRRRRAAGTPASGAGAAPPRGPRSSTAGPRVARGLERAVGLVEIGVQAPIVEDDRADHGGDAPTKATA